MGPGLQDIIETCRRWPFVVYMAWSDIRARYKRSVLGPGWITISTAVGVVGLGFIWSELFHMERSTYIPTLTVGLVTWQFLSGCITESAGILGRQANTIRNFNLPLSMYSAQLVLRQAINFAHSFPLFIVVILVLGRPFSWHMLAFFPNFLLMAANVYWICLLIGILGARFRDLEYFISMVMPLMMFISPVMYRPNALSFSSKYIWINPLADMIELIRHPLLGEATPMFLYSVNFGLLVVGSMTTLLLFNAKRNRIAFWV